jgi:hypothetical protein
MRAQREGRTVAEAPADKPSVAKCEHADAVGKRWGDPISAERQAELQAILDAWSASGGDHDERAGPFDVMVLSENTREHLRLTGADVYWLAERVREKSGEVFDLHLEHANLSGAHLEGAALRNAHLQFANFDNAYLTEADLTLAQLEAAYLRNTHLARTHLTGAFLGGAYLEAANMEMADLTEADLAAAYLGGAHLAGANLRGVELDSETTLDDVTLAQPMTLLQRLLIWLPIVQRNTGATLGDMRWGGVGTVNLTAVEWDDVLFLGDEREAEFRADAKKHATAVRAYRQLVAQLRAQGMTEVADRFAHRAQIVQRRVLRKQRHYGQWLGSCFLSALAGYGYAPMRTIFWYLVFVFGFMWSYIQVSHGAHFFGLTQPICGAKPTAGCFPPLHWYEALVLSVASFHGRGFFPQGINLGDPVAILAAGEAVIGLIIEVSFIATFTQRFFGAK